MIRIILGVITGFIVWSVVWAGGQKTLVMLSPNWIGSYMSAAERSLATGEQNPQNAAVSGIILLLSLVTSLIAGYMCALVAGEYKRSTMALSVILILVGILVEYSYWNMAPAWYHILFVLLLAPMTILGGRLRRPS